MIDRTPPAGFDADGIAPPPLPVRDWGIDSIALDTAGRCNMACRYCAEALTQPARPPMPAEMLERAVRFLLSFPARGSRSIHVGSGEPLLELPLLRRLHDLVREAGDPRLSVHLTTNATLATPEVRDWLVASGWRIKVSLDGPSQVHDRWRPGRDGRGSYELVAETVRDLAARLPIERFSVNSVLCRGTDPEEVVGHLVLLGVRRIELVPVASLDPGTALTPADSERYARFLMDHARRFLETKEWGEIVFLAEFRKCIFRLMGYRLERINCTAGRSFLGIGPDGGLYPCFRFIGVEPHRLGRIETGLDRGAARAFQRGAGREYGLRAGCAACWAGPLCGGPCFAVAEMFGPGDGRPLPVHCAFQFAEGRAAAWLVDHLRRHDPDRLLGFFPPGILEALA
jgi:uncharacterized protein